MSKNSPSSVLARVFAPLFRCGDYLNPWNFSKTPVKLRIFSGSNVQAFFFVLRVWYVHVVVQKKFIPTYSFRLPDSEDTLFGFEKWELNSMYECTEQYIKTIKNVQNWQSVWVQDFVEFNKT